MPTVLALPTDGYTAEAAEWTMCDAPITANPLDADTSDTILLLLTREEAQLLVWGLNEVEHVSSLASRRRAAVTLRARVLQALGGSK